MSKISKYTNKSTTITHGDGVTLTNESTMPSTLGFCFQLLCHHGTALALCTASLNASQPSRLHG